MLNVEVNNGLPPMAWVSTIGGSGANVACGNKVRVYENGVYEGGWALTDSPAHCDPRGHYAGSGLFFANGTWNAIAPTQTVEGVYVVRSPAHITVSNSLACAVTKSGIQDFRLGAAAGPIFALVKGLDAYPRIVFETTSCRIERYTYGTFDVLASAETRHVPSYSFRSYRDYKYFLLRCLKDIQSSSALNKRVTYLSRGYDSPACAALMAELGGGIAMTIQKSRDGTEDDGTPIAKALNLESVILTPKARPTAPHWKGGVATRFSLRDAPEIGEFCVGLGMWDLPLQAPDRIVADSLITTGFHGDKLWSRGPPSSDVQRGDMSGAGLYEFRLRTGFVHVVVPMLGALLHSQIRAISTSREMTPWRLGVRYDRPIPRRIAEEAGVPRHLFGQKKAAVATLANNLDHVRDAFFGVLRERYRQALGLN